MVNKIIFWTLLGHFGLIRIQIYYKYKRLCNIFPYILLFNSTIVQQQNGTYFAHIQHSTKSYFHAVSKIIRLIRLICKKTFGWT